MATAEVEEPPILLGGRPDSNQNPLKFFEVLLKGFCPTIIVDRVDVHDEDLAAAAAAKRGPAVVRPRKQQPVVAASSVRDTPTTTTTTTASRRTKKKASAPSTPKKNPAAIVVSNVMSTPQRTNGKRARTSEKATKLHHHHHHHHDKPFEIAERPPSDVIGISKRIWEGFCYNPVQNESTTGTHPNKKIGFCSLILTDHMGCVSDDDDNDVPDGEECSVGTFESTASVDLSPQSSPRNVVESSVDGYYNDNNDDDDDVSLLLMDDDGECYYEEEEEENLPLAEFQDRRTYRGTQVLLMTILALYATLSLLRSAGHTRMHFALESKYQRNNRHQRSIAKPITFAISTR